MKKRRILSALMSLILLLEMAFFSGITVKAEASEENKIIRNDETGIPDENMYRLVLEQCDTNEDGLLTKSEAEACEELGLSTYDKVNCIHDITGIQYFINLNFLSLCNSMVEDISLLSNLNKLEHLDLSQDDKTMNYEGEYQGNICDISALTNLTNLRSLYLSSNSINDISALKNLVNIEYLDIRYNQIEDISVLENFKNLRFVGLTNNKIRNTGELSILKNLEFKKLDLSNNEISDLSGIAGLADSESLTEINLSNNKISDISPLQGFTYLSRLNLSENEISDISALSDKTFSSLNLSNNHISDISPLASVTFNPKDLDEFDELDLSGNNISDISSLNIPEKQMFFKVDFSHNKIEDINVLKNLLCVQLYLSDNKISEVPELQVLNNSYEPDESNESNFYLAGLVFDISNNKISDISNISQIQNGALRMSMEYLEEVGFIPYFGFNMEHEWFFLLNWYMKIAQGNKISREAVVNVFPDRLLNAPVRVLTNADSWSEDINEDSMDCSWLEWQGFEPAYVKEGPVVTAEEFADLLEENKVQDVIVKSNEGTLFTFGKETMKSVEGIEEYDFGVEISNDYKSIEALEIFEALKEDFVTDKFIAKVNFNLSGQFPAEASVTINVDKKYAGQTVNYIELAGDSSAAIDDVQTVTVDESGNITVKQSVGSSHIVMLAASASGVLGDVNNSGDVTAVDARLVLQYAAGNYDLSEEKVIFADVNGDKDVTAIDARMILQKAAGNLDF